MEGLFGNLKERWNSLYSLIFKERTELITKRCKSNKYKFPASSKYYRVGCDLGENDIFNITSDSMMLALLANYYRCQPYYRQNPTINVTHPSDEKIGYNDFWHYDTVNQMTSHILLCDTSESENCMLYAKGSHHTHKRYISNNNYYSKAYINDNFEIVSCVGESGTIVIFVFDYIELISSEVHLDHISI